jgi:hypothetical protein
VINGAILTPIRREDIEDGDIERVLRAPDASQLAYDAMLSSTSHGRRSSGRISGR